MDGALANGVDIAGLLDLGAAVHHEGPAPHDAPGDRLAPEDEDPARPPGLDAEVRPLPGEPDQVLRRNLRPVVHDDGPARDEEEGELFPKVRKAFSADELAALGNECMALFESLLEAGDPRMNVPAETREAAPLPAM